jgi:hypothetical protein
VNRYCETCRHDNDNSDRCRDCCKAWFRLWEGREEPIAPKLSDRESIARRFVRHECGERDE